jgi:hypothetical protein
MTQGKGFLSEESARSPYAMKALFFRGAKLLQPLVERSNQPGMDILEETSADLSSLRA